MSGLTEQSGSAADVGGPGDRPPTPVEGDAPGAPSRRHPVRTILEWGAIIVAALVVALLIKSFVVEAFWIPSGSMEPTLNIGDRVLVSKLSYDVHSVHRGDIVVFAKPANDDAPGVKDLIKRVIGLPGDTISAANGHVYIDGKLLSETYLPKGVVTTGLPPTKVPKGDYFMLGDNRGDSADSRVIGPVPGNLIVGHAFARVWPLSRLDWF